MTPFQKPISAQETQVLKSLRARTGGGTGMDQARVSGTRSSGAGTRGSASQAPQSGISLAGGRPAMKSNPYEGISSQDFIEEEPDEFFDLEGESERSTRSRSTTKRRTSASADEARGARGGRASGSRADASSTTRQRREAASVRGSSKRSSGCAMIALVVALVAAAGMGVGGYYLWDMFFRYDDAADIQGEWRTDDGSMTIVIDATDIHMPELTYAYEIDTQTKQISFTFSELSGSASYAFSDDRSQLTLTEGEGEDASVTVLVKISDDTEATPQLLGTSASEESTSDTEGTEAGNTADDTEADDVATDTAKTASDTTEAQGEAA